MTVENHVTRERRQHAETLVGLVSLDDFPPLTPTQVDFLRKVFKPRCWDPSKETDVMHLKYAGKVELAQSLIEHSERRSPEVDLGLDADAEKAT